MTAGPWATLFRTERNTLRRSCSSSTTIPESWPCENRPFTAMTSSNTKPKLIRSFPGIRSSAFPWRRFPESKPPDAKVISDRSVPEIFPERNRPLPKLKSPRIFGSLSSVGVTSGLSSVRICWLLRSETSWSKDLNHEPRFSEVLEPGKWDERINASKVSQR